jgi:hypothetical protein
MWFETLKLQSSLSKTATKIFSAILKNPIFYDNKDDPFGIVKGRHTITDMGF